MKSTYLHSRFCKCGRSKPLDWTRCESCRQAWLVKMRAAREAFAEAHEPTQDEVDAMVRRQMRNLPKWWDR